MRAHRDVAGLWVHEVLITSFLNEPGVIVTHFQPPSHPPPQTHTSATPTRLFAVKFSPRLINRTVWSIAWATQLAFVAVCCWALARATQLGCPARTSPRRRPLSCGAIVRFLALGLATVTVEYLLRRQGPSLRPCSPPRCPFVYTHRAVAHRAVTRHAVTHRAVPCTHVSSGDSVGPQVSVACAPFPLFRIHRRPPPATLATHSRKRPPATGHQFPLPPSCALALQGILWGSVYLMAHSFPDVEPGPVGRALDPPWGACCHPGSVGGGGNAASR
jgi:hypothetical protein